MNKHKLSEIKTDILIIGSGIAGLSLALDINEKSNYSICIITKSSLDEANTKYAQGGFASVLTKGDSFEEHIKDTLIAGAGLCKTNVVNEIITKAPNAIQQLIDRGVNFDKLNNGNFELGREGGHHTRRIAHVKDYTGLAIEQALVNRVKKSNIEIYEDHIAIDLVYISNQIAGAYVMNKHDNCVYNFSAKVTVIATGGVGRAFLYTSNPDVATGDGIAMAYRAGAVIANLEFIQFHPTIYYNTKFRRFLISEAVRGEGAILKTIDGKRIMKGRHELEDLAPRDIVARIIDEELKRTGDDHVLLDISFKDPEFIKSRFPGIYHTLLEHGTDMTKEPIPVVPAAHYTMGGIKTDTNGQTTLNGLFAIGEASCTGFHGANRLASNSLLEAAVMASNASTRIIDELDNNKYKILQFAPWEPGNAIPPDEAVIVSHNWDEVRKLMWNYVGIVRSDKRLLRARERIKMLRNEVREYYWQFHVSPDIIELRNIVDISDLIICGALSRKESRGAHYNLNYLNTLEIARDTLIQKTLGVFHSEPIL